MPEAIFEIRKDQKVLATYRLLHLQLTRESVEAALLNISALKSDQYEVYYLDAENDLIMAAGEEDYSIAEQTLQGDIIQFQIEVKVDEAEIKLSEELKAKEEQSDDQRHSNRSGQKEQQASFSNPSSQGVVQHDQLQFDKGFKVDDKGQEEGVKEHLPKQNSPQEKYPQKIEESIIATSSQPLHKKQQQQQNQQALKGQAEVAQEGGSPSSQSDPAQNSDTNKSQKLVSSMSQKLLDINQQIPITASQADNNQISQNNPAQDQPQAKSRQSLKGSELIQKLLADQELADKLFDTFCLKLPRILKPECFKVPLQQSEPKTISTQHNFICNRCQTTIKQLPFYVTQSSFTICQNCQQTFDGEELLIKVKSSKKARQLLTVKIVPVLKDDLRRFCQSQAELTAVRDNNQLLRRRANQVALEKIGLQIKNDGDRLFY